MDCLERLVAEAQPFHHAGAVVLDEDVVAGEHLEEQFAAPLGAQIDGDGALVGIPVDEVVRVELAVVVDAAAGVADAGLLDLDHVGSVPGEGLSAGCACLVLSHVEDSESVECWHGASSCGQGQGAANRREATFGITIEKRTDR